MKPAVFFDLGWTLEDESDAQVVRAESAVHALASHGVTARVEDILSL